MRKIVGKAALVVVILAGLSWLFLKTVRDTIAEPYVIEREALSGWTLVIEDADAGGPALLALQPPIQLVADVFRQIFLRSGQSLASPTRPSMPIVLQSEYAGGLKGVLSPSELLDAGRKAGLEGEPLEPVCVGIKQDSRGVRPTQRFFLVFESRAFGRFREELARMRESRGGSGRFEPGALRPVLPVASSEPDFHLWGPLEVDPDVDCKVSLVFGSPER